MARNPFLWWLPDPDRSEDGAPAAPPAGKRPARGGAAAGPDDPPSAPEPAALDEQPGQLIRRAQQIAVAIFLEECAGSGLTPVQHAALLAVGDNPGADATRISGIVGLDRTTISGVLERMEAKGLIARTENARDRRAKLLEATAKGRKLLRRLEPQVAAAQQRILGPLSAAERAQLMGLLGKLVALNNDASRAPRRAAGEA